MNEGEVENYIRPLTFGEWSISWIYFYTHRHWDALYVCFTPKPEGFFFYYVRHSNTCIEYSCMFQALIVIGTRLDAHKIPLIDLRWTHDQNLKTWSKYVCSFNSSSLSRKPDNMILESRNCSLPKLVLWEMANDRFGRYLQFLKHIGIFSTTTATE